LCLSLNKEWATVQYPDKLRELIFKFRNNLLGLNTRVSHFNANTERACTFCKLNNVPVPVPDESFRHLFFDCEQTRISLVRFFNKYMPDFIFHDDTFLLRYLFCGVNVITEKRDNFFLSTVAISAMFYIWECKLRKIKPSAEELANDIFYGIESISRASSTMILAMNLDLHICRNWKAECSRRE
jgi:hypothetical protein